MPAETVEAVCTCADGAIAGYLVVGVFLVLVTVPALYARRVEARRQRAIVSLLRE